MLQKTFSVIGLGYGDEGKGTVVDYLAAKYPNNSLVIRHSGGHQVGHTVKVGEIIHEFRNFGSGTFRGVPTYYDKVCTVFPLGFHIEYDALYKKNPDIIPVVYIHPLCPVTTLYDVAYNRAKDAKLGHGSVGMGFAATIKRNELHSLTAFNLKYPVVVANKLTQIDIYYYNLAQSENIEVEYTRELAKLHSEGYTRGSYLKSCKFFIKNVTIQDLYEDDFYDSFEYLIYEGNQGILLDKEHGFFPHVTYGKTTNATIGAVNEAYYVTRSYITKHGAGPLHNEGELLIPLINDEHEQNHLNPWQGSFRTGLLDFDFIEYAIEADAMDVFEHSGGMHDKTYLVITCMDQIVEPLMTITDEDGFKAAIPLLPELFAGIVDVVLTNNSPESSTIKQYIEFNYDNH